MSFDWKFCYDFGAKLLIKTHLQNIHKQLFFFFVTNRVLTFYCPNEKLENDTSMLNADLVIYSILLLSVCLLFINLNLRYNFWTVRDRDSIFGMYISRMMNAVSIDTKILDLVTITVANMLKIAFFELFLLPGTVCLTNTSCFIR